MMLRIRNIHDKKAVASYIEKLPEGKKYDVTISLKREKRTLPQNKLYWMWLTIMAEDIGTDKNYLHNEFSNRYLDKEEVTGIHGEVIYKPISTTKLNTAQFTKYLDQIQVFASSELGIVLPTPEHEAWSIFVEQFDQ